jgi:hypothetical protein
MKNNITTSEHLMGCKVIEFVSFLTNWIAKKKTTFGARGKFLGFPHKFPYGSLP